MTPFPTSDVLRFRDARASSKDKHIRVLSREPVVEFKFATRKYNGHTNREGHIVTFLAEGGISRRACHWAECLGSSSQCCSTALINECFKH